MLQDCIKLSKQKNKIIHNKLRWRIWVNQTFDYMLIKLTSIQKGTKYDFNWQRNDKMYFIS